MEKEVFDRLLAEFNDLNEKITKLRDFITNTEKFEKLDPLNRDLLIAQLKTMEGYISILSIRIGLNAPKEEVAQTGFSQAEGEVVSVDGEVTSATVSE